MTLKTRTAKGQKRYHIRFESSESQSLKVLFLRLLLADRGAAAIELAIVIPLMVLFIFASLELYMYVRTVSEVEHTAFTVADVLGQATQIINTTATDNPNNLGSIWNDAALLAAPLALTTHGTVIITSICDSTTAPCGKTAATNSMVAGSPQIYWTAQSPWNQSTLSASNEQTGSLLPSTWPFRNGDSAIVVEVAYTYSPFPITQTLWPSAPTTATIYKRVYVRSRSGSPLPLVSS